MLIMVVPITSERPLDQQCARVMGWTWQDDRAWSPTGSVCSRLNGDPWWWLERYSSDHAAARLLEDEIDRRGLIDEYIEKLIVIVDAPDLELDVWPKYSDLWKLAHSTPEQRARAFLAAIEGR